MGPRFSNRMSLFVVLALASMLLSHGSASAAVMFDTTESSPYLIISRNVKSGNTDVSTNNFELGANKAPVPANTSFIDSGGGPTLEGAVPDLPGNHKPVDQGIGGHGNIAVTDPSGEFKLQDVGVYADPGIGIRMAAPNESFNKSSNAFFNDPNMFPNSFNTGTQMGLNVNPNDADQNTRIDPSGGGHPSDNVGMTYGFDFTDLLTELSDARTAINGLSVTNVLDVSGGNAGELENGSSITGAGSASLTVGAANSLSGPTITFNAAPGLNVIDIVTGSNDFLVNNANFVVDGPAGSTVIFRLMGTDNMLITNSNVLLGNSGIGMNNVLFYSNNGSEATHFNMNNTIINGVAFWSLNESGTIGISNAQGSTQLIADLVVLSDVRLTRWSFIPEPASFALLGLGGLVVAGRRRR